VSEDNREGGTLILQRPILEADSKKPPSGDACLVNLYPPGPDIGRRIPLLSREYVVGRDAEAGLVVSRSSVSRLHAKLYSDDAGNWWVEDLGSTNGTFVNGERITSTRLDEGDEITIGRTHAVFRPGKR